MASLLYYEEGPVSAVCELFPEYSALSYQRFIKRASSVVRYRCLRLGVPHAIPYVRVLFHLPTRGGGG